MVGICKFCNQEKCLCKAHIIPKWAYRKLYPNNKIEGEALIMLSIDDKTKKRSPQGAYDPNILCKECDNSFSKYEAYAEQTLTEENLITIKLSSGKYLYKLKSNPKPDYLAYFFYGILYKLTITKIELYKHLIWPPDISEQLKQLLHKNPQISKEFPFYITKYKDDPINLAKNAIPVPYVNHLDGYTIVVISLGNSFNVVIKIAGETQENTIFQTDPLFLCNYIFSFQTIFEHPYFSQFIETLTKSKYTTTVQA